MLSHPRSLAFAAICGSILVFLLNRASPPKPPLIPGNFGVSPVWDVGQIPVVSMFIENSRHYAMNSSEADNEWAALIPKDNGIIRIGPRKEPFMPAVFHQLKCLDIIRRAYVAQGEEMHRELSSKSRHCLNYLRQTLMCRPDLRLEPVVDPFGPHAVQPYGFRTCKDWRLVYEAFGQYSAE